MTTFQSDTNPANQAAVEAADRDESVALMEPLLIAEGSRHRVALTDLVVELAARSAGFRRSLLPGVLTSLPHLVRAINCYYSNLIEGHDTHPIDIERALRNDYSRDQTKRDLQLEAKAHIAVQAWIDAGGLHGRASTVEGIVEIHRRFTELLPDALQWTEHPDSGDRLRVVPGELRHRDVRVGRHISLSPAAVPSFLAKFERVYSKLGRTDTVLAAAAAHHRLLWIHPFLNGNGRVARLMSYAMLLETLDTGGVWSIAKGLARNVSQYKSELAACDLPRRNDLDGRGQLSEESLATFTTFLLQTCIDQVSFMEALLQPERLRDRILTWAAGEIRASRLPAQSGRFLEAILYRGELSRGEVVALLGTSDLQARRITSALIEREVLTSESSRAPLRLAFPAKLASRWMPGLFPENAE